eukprot:TRINITY_DN15438_c0_g1_i1.p1 TRINITY_DN15438_c0_g1~~TRINITY_DN15438_c0_g1_i1.p1  ORF type:complete len:640 (+),score=65.66 TRINITY_DN15438_c0_g1_i1:82-2001(+)
MESSLFNLFSKDRREGGEKAKMDHKTIETLACEMDTSDRECGCLPGSNNPSTEGWCEACLEKKRWVDYRQKSGQCCGSKSLLPSFQKYTCGKCGEENLCKTCCPNHLCAWCYFEQPTQDKYLGEMVNIAIYSNMEWSKLRELMTDSIVNTNTQSEAVILFRNKLPRPAGNWMPDELSQSCFSCGVEFGFIIRKHHCRRCGKIFCGKCTKFHSQAERVCALCINSPAEYLRAFVEAYSPGVSYASIVEALSKVRYVEWGFFAALDEAYGCTFFQSVKKMCTILSASGSYGADVLQLLREGGKGKESVSVSRFRASLGNVSKWKPDCTAIVCTGCSVPFSLTVRKHHCRFCGEIFCRSCTRFKRSDNRACGVCEIPVKKAVETLNTIYPNTKDHKELDYLLINDALAVDTQLGIHFFRSWIHCSISKMRTYSKELDTWSPLTWFCRFGANREVALAAWADLFSWSGSAAMRAVAEAFVTHYRRRHGKFPSSAEIEKKLPGDGWCTVPVRNVSENDSFFDRILETVLQNSSDGVSHNIDSVFKLELGFCLDTLPDFFFVKEGPQHFAQVAGAPTINYTNLIESRPTRSIQSASECSICTEPFSIVHALVPCGHVSVCGRCINKLTNCPKCHKKIAQSVRLYQ